MRDVAVLAQVIAERQGAPLFVSSVLYDVNMMRVRPCAWSMEERTHRIVGMRHVDVAQRGSYGEICSGCRLKRFTVPSRERG